MLVSVLFVLGATGCRRQDVLTESKIAELKNSVVRVFVLDYRDSILGTATGFYVADVKPDPVLGKTWSGRVVTNEHVVRPGSRYVVELLDGTKLEASVRLEDPESDLAILWAIFDRTKGDTKTKAQRPPLVVEARRALREGEHVWSIGSPMALGWTVADGIVSASRDVGPGQVRIQHTVPASPGSSGSPLLDSRGRVVGVVCSGITEGANLGFAVPARRIQQCLLLSEAPSETSTTSRVVSGPDSGITATQWWKASLARIDAVLALDTTYRLAYSKRFTVLRLLMLATRAEDTHHETRRRFAQKHQGLIPSDTTTDPTLEFLEEFLRRKRAEVQELMIFDTALSREALDAAVRALQLNPNIPETHRDLAVAYMICGADSQAIWENRITRLMVGTYENELRAALLTDIAKLLLRTGDTAQAVAMLPYFALVVNDEARTMQECLERYRRRDGIQVPDGGMQALFGAPGVSTSNFAELDSWLLRDGVSPEMRMALFERLTFIKMTTALRPGVNALAPYLWWRLAKRAEPLPEVERTALDNGDVQTLLACARGER